MRMLPGTRYKQCCIALIALSLSSLAQANIYTSVVTPHTRIVAGDLSKNEFFILGQGESPPVKSSQTKTTHQLAKINKQSAKPTKLATRQKHVAKVVKKKAVLASKAKAKSVRHHAKPTKLATRQKHVAKVIKKKAVLASKAKAKSVRHHAKPTKLATRQKHVAKVVKKKAVLASKAKAKSVRHHVASKKLAPSKQRPVRVASRKPMLKQVDQVSKPNLIWQRQEQIAEDDRL